MSRKHRKHIPALESLEDRTLFSVNVAPVLAPISTLNCNEGKYVSLKFGATDANGDKLTWSAKNLPPAAILNPVNGNFGWTPRDGSDGPWDVVVTVSDGVLTDTKVLHMNIGNNPNYTLPPQFTGHAPVLSGPTTLTATQGKAIATTLAATDAEHQTMTWVGTSLPTGATLNPTTGLLNWTPTVAGTYTVNYLVLDGRQATPGSLTITVAAPNTAPVVAPIADVNAVEAAPITIKPTATDAEGNKLTWSAANLPAGATFDAATQTFAWTPTYDQAGTYNVTFAASDGLLSGSAVAKIVVGNTNRVPVADAIADTSVTAGAPITIRPTGSDPDGQVLTWTAANLPAGATFDAGTQTFAWTPAKSQVGTYSVIFTATDGEAVASSIANIIVAAPPNNAPVVAAIADKSVTAGTAVTITPTASDVDGDALTWTASGLPTGATFDASTQAFNWTPTTAGTFNVTFTASDSKASASAAAKITVAAAAPINSAPVLTPMGPYTSNEGVYVSLKFGATDPNGNTMTWSAKNLPPGSVLNPANGNFGWTPRDGSDGPWDVVVTVSNGKASSTEVVRFNIGNNPNYALAPQWTGQAPALSGPTALAASRGNALSATLSASDADGQALMWLGTSMPAGATLDAATGQFNWTPAADGQYTVQYLVMDGRLATPGSLTISVGGTGGTPVNNAPVVAAIADKSVAAGTAVAITPTATDADGDALTWTASGVPAGATFNANTHTFNWTPTAAGTYNVVFTASDGKASASSVAKIVVSASAPVNSAPVVSAITDKNVTTGTAVTITPTATDADGDALTWTASGLPTGATFNANTHTFSWTPASAGTFNVTFTASDGQASASAAARITVTSPTLPPPTGGTNNPGQGGSNTTMIDRDGDGYGVNSPLGMDADDSDPTVNTYQTALNKYGSTQGILQHLGYNPLRIIYVAANGNNSTGVIGDINHPFQTWKGVQSLVKAGDAVIFRGGTYVNDQSQQKNNNINVSYMNGTADNPITIMGMPGENVYQDTANNEGSGVGLDHSSYINIDNFITNNSSPDGFGKGVGMSFVSNINVKNINSSNHLEGIMGMQDLHNVLFDNIVSHDNPGEHGMYLGAREYPNSNVTIQNSLVYGNNWQGIQLNGRGTNYVVQNNIIHTNGQLGIQLIQGVCDSTIRNNLIFNNGKSAISFYFYDSTDVNIAPYSMDNNLVENNTIWIGPNSNMGNNPEQASAILFSDTTAAGNHSANNNTFRNNIFYTYGGPIFKFNSSNSIATTKIENNVFYRTLGNSQVMTFGSTAYSMSAFNSYSSLFKNNVFADPLFTSASANDFTTPAKYDFDLLSGSPAINLGSTTDAPTFDLRYNSRVGLPDAGAYEYVV